MPVAKTVANAMRIIAEAGPEIVGQMLEDDPSLAEVRKATPHAPTVEYIEDESHNPHGRGPRGEGSIGPAESASGGGAERMIRDYSPDTAQQGLADLANRLGAALASLADTAKALQTLARKAARKDDDEQEDEEQEDGERQQETPPGADKARRMPPTFRGSIDSALSGNSTIEMDIRDLFRVLVGAGDVAKSNIALAKAAGAVDNLPGMHQMAAQRLLQRASAVNAGVYSASTFAREMANTDGEVVSAILNAVRA